MTDEAVELARYNWQDRSVLVVDGDEAMRRGLERTLARHCGLVHAVADAGQAAPLMARLHFDLLIVELAPPADAGLAWLHALREQGGSGVVILLAAGANLDTAIGALRGGAADLLLKPLRPEQLLESIRRCFDRAPDAGVLRREQATPALERDGLVGHSPAIEQLRGLVRRVGAMPSTVLLLGESGTGKEVVARALHRCSPRAARPFVPLNCAAVAAGLIESELFGHVKGAFTGATEQRDGLFVHADGGTLFLDEVGELPPAMQTRLLRVLEERTLRPLGAERERAVDVRLVAASNRDLAAEVRGGRFRADLYYRLAVLEVAIPPLRARREDIQALVRHFMPALSARLGVDPLVLTHGVASRLAAHPWPGNVRELRNFVERSLILGAFALDSLQPPAQRSAGESALSLREVEKRHILHVVADCAGNRSEAARRLGLSRRTLERKFAEWAAGDDGCAPAAGGERGDGTGG